MAKTVKETADSSLPIIVNGYGVFVEDENGEYHRIKSGDCMPFFVCDVWENARCGYAKGVDRSLRGVTRTLYENVRSVYANGATRC